MANNVRSEYSAHEAEWDVVWICRIGTCGIICQNLIYCRHHSRQYLLI
jgi:hypothetical protein